jgi:hypothetical protein
MFYFVALYRIHANYKISAPVCWVQISGPAVVLYGVSIFGQPVSDEAELELASSQENIQHFTYVHQKFYMPIMHALFVCCIVSMVSALYCLSVRFKRFKEKEFSPAHVAFCAPILSVSFDHCLSENSDYLLYQLIVIRLNQSIQMHFKCTDQPSKGSQCCPMITCSR